MDCVFIELQILHTIHKSVENSCTIFMSKEYGGQKHFERIKNGKKKCSDASRRNGSQTNGKSLLPSPSVGTFFVKSHDISISAVYHWTCVWLISTWAHIIIVIIDSFPFHWNVKIFIICNASFVKIVAGIVMEIAFMRAARFCLLWMLLTKNSHFFFLLIRSFCADYSFRSSHEWIMNSPAMLQLMRERERL